MIRTTLGGLLLLLLGSTSCILLSSSEATQCASDADCAALGDEFAGARCDAAANVCVIPTADGTGGSGTTSSTASSTSGTGGSASACTSNAQCIEENGEQPYQCSRETGACVALIVPGCTELIGDVEELKSEEPLILGLLTPYNDDAVTYDGLLTRNAVRLMVEELQSAASGLPIGTNGQRRPVLFLGCDEKEGVEEAARHLVEDVGVPAIYGPIDPQNAIDVAANVTIPAGVAMITPGGSKSLTTVEDSGLVSVLRYEGRGAGEATAHMVNEIEERVRFVYGLPVEEPTRVAVLLRSDTVGAELGSGFDDVFLLNGSDINTNIDAGNVERLGIPLDGSDFSAQVSSVLALEPHIIVVMMDGPAGSELIRQVETNWVDGVPFPVWATDSTGKSNAVADVFLEMRELRGDVVRRPFLLMVPFLSPERDNYNDFSVRFRTRFPQLVAGTGEAPQAYDASWILAYAAVGAGSVATLDGRAMANGFGELQGPGASVNIGPDYVNEALSPLKAGQSIQFLPTLRAFSLDADGNSSAYFVAGCTDGGAAAANYTDFGYDPLTQETEGTDDLGATCVEEAE